MACRETAGWGGEEMKEPRSLSIGTGKTKRASDRGGMSVTDYRDGPEDAAASEANC